MGLIRILIYGLAALLAYTIYKRIVGSPSRRTVNVEEDERIGRLVQDPYCEVYVDRDDALRKKFKGSELYFCSKDCADAYVREQREA